MKALLLRDMYNNKLYKYTIIVVVTIGFSILFTTTHNYSYLFWLNLLMFINFRLNFLNDHNTNWNVYLKTLPVSSKQIITSRYISFLIDIVLSVFTFTVINVGYSFFNQIDYMMIINDSIILFSFDIVLQSIACIILYSCNDKQSYTIYVILNAILLVCFIFHGKELKLGQFIYSKIGTFCIFISVIIYIASLFISIRFNNKFSRRIIETNS